MTFKNLRYGLSSSVVLAASLFSVPSYAATDSIGLTVITTVEIGTCTATLVNDSDQDISVCLLYTSDAADELTLV